VVPFGLPRRASVAGDADGLRRASLRLAAAGFRPALSTKCHCGWGDRVGPWIRPDVGDDGIDPTRRRRGE